MTVRTTLFFLTLLFGTPLLGQSRTLTGKIIDYEFNTLYQVTIFNGDTIALATSDVTGNFSISIPPETKRLIFASVGMEWKIIDLLNDCNYLEIILQPRWTYDFKTPAKVDRLRKKQFDKLPALHQAAFEKGVFNANKGCYIDRFIPQRKWMLERYRTRIRVSDT